MDHPTSMALVPYPSFHAVYLIWTDDSSTECGQAMLLLDQNKDQLKSLPPFLIQIALRIRSMCTCSCPALASKCGYLLECQT